MGTESYLRCLADSAQILGRNEDWPESMHRLLALVREATAATRSWMFQTIAVGTTDIVQDHIFECPVSPAWTLHPNRRFRLFRTQLTDPCYRVLIQGRVLGQPSFIITRRLPQGVIRESLERQDTLSMVTAPVMVDGVWWGTLGIDDCETERSVNEPTLRLMQAAAGLISGSIHRERHRARAKQVDVMERSTGGGTWEMDFAQGRLWCSQALLRLLGYPAPFARMTARRLMRHVVKEDRAALMAALRACFAGRDPGFRMDLRLNRKGGAVSWWEVVTDVSEVCPDTGRPMRLTGLVLEVEHRKARELELSHRASTDPLTGLANRRCFESLATRRLGDSGGGHRLLLLDIDRFKTVNDRFGHAAGDAVLQRVATVCRTVLRDGDLIGRIGGEEFAVLLDSHDIAPDEIAARLCQGIRETAVSVRSLEDAALSLRVTASIGISRPTPGGMGAQDALAWTLRSADRALYQAKTQGRNRVCEDGGVDGGADDQEFPRESA